MKGHWSIDVFWWISAVEIPVLASLFWFVLKSRHELDRNAENNRRFFDRGTAQLKEALFAYKLEVAKSYASISYIKDLEKRITSHLLRIEEKLDATGGHH